MTEALIISDECFGFFCIKENGFNEIAGVLSDNPPTLLANIKSVSGKIPQSEPVVNSYSVEDDTLQSPAVTAPLEGSRASLSTLVNS